MRYESRIDDIWEDMDDLNVEEIKRQILETHVLPRSRPSTPQDHSNNAPPAPPLFFSYTRIDDFTAVVTATVLQALPNLSRLNALMNVWSVRLAVLRQVSPLVLALDDTELALRSGWNAISITETAGTGSKYKSTSNEAEAAITRQGFEIMRNLLQDKVTVLGQRLDHVLDALEGQEDTIPEAWLDRMEVIEQEYGEWAVCGDRKVREGEWAREAARRQQEEKENLAEAEPELPQAAVQGPKKLETDEVQPATTETEEDSIMDQRSHGEIYEDADESTPGLSQFAIDSSAAGILDESLISADILRGESSPFLPEHENSGHVDGRIRPTEPLTDSELENQGSEQGHAFAENADKHVDGNPTFVQPLVEDSNSHTESNIENPTSTKTDPASKDFSSVELVTADTGEDRNVALSSEKEINGSVAESVESSLDSLSDLESSQSITPPQSPVSRFPPFDGTLEVDKVTELQEASRQSQDDLLTSELVNPETPSSPAAGEESLRGRLIGADEPSSLPSNGDQPDVTGDGRVSDRSFDSEDPIEDNTSRLESPSSSILAYAQNDARSAGPEPTTQKEVDEAAESTTSLASHLSFTTPEPSDDDEAPSTPRTPSPSSESSVIHAIKSPSNQPRNGYYVDDGGTPRSPSKVQRLSRDFANVLKQIRPSNIPSSPGISTSLSSDQKPPESINSAHYDASSLRAQPITEDAIDPEQRAEVRTSSPLPTNLPTTCLTKDAGQIFLPNVSTPTPKPEYARPTMSTTALRTKLLSTYLPPAEEAPEDTKGFADTHSRELSVIGCSSSEHTQALNDAEPNQHFDPIPSPIRDDDIKMDVLDVVDLTRLYSPIFANSASEPASIPETPTTLSVPQTRDPTLYNTADPDLASTDSSEDFEITGNMVESDTNEAFAREQRISIPQGVSEPAMVLRKESTSSSTSTIINERPTRSVETPRAPSPINAELPQPPVTVNNPAPSESVYEGSPSFGRIRIYDDLGSYSPPSSPPMPTISKRRQLQPILSPPFDPNALSPDSPVTPGEAPLLSSIEVLPAPVSSPSKVSTDQFQQQISEILDSIPARIRLTSEPDSDRRSDILQPKKRPSLGTGFRPMSRSSTPSFTLAPAYAKNPRPRAQTGHPEIKLYHLSRGTGEAPIKLFVRLVGENGERVMVRVGGGWADLGEYLKEYASHHGRKSDKAGKVEIQDLPSRVISVGSTHSVSNLRNSNGRSSPVSRPTSSLERPLSSLAVRKTRKSVGEDVLRREQRSPSTPQPYTTRSTPPVPRPSETPPSATSRPVSRLSWSEEESPLGLAGPTSKKVDISAENAAWVESMKEKVRLASAEKKEKTTAVATDFGQLGKVGGTKRLFKRGGAT
jgi:hypothetical protein